MSVESCWGKTPHLSISSAIKPARSCGLGCCFRMVHSCLGAGHFTPGSHPLVPFYQAAHPRAAFQPLSSLGLCSLRIVGCGCCPAAPTKGLCWGLKPSRCQEPLLTLQLSHVAVQESSRTPSRRPPGHFPAAGAVFFLRVPFPLVLLAVCKCLCRTKAAQAAQRRLLEAQSVLCTARPGRLHWLQMLGGACLCWGFGSSALPAEPRARARGQPGVLLSVGVQRPGNMEGFPLMPLWDPAMTHVGSRGQESDLYLRGAALASLDAPLGRRSRSTRNWLQERRAEQVIHDL